MVTHKVSYRYRKCSLNVGEGALYCVAQVVILGVGVYVSALKHCFKLKFRIQLQLRKNKNIVMLEWFYDV